MSHFNNSYTRLFRIYDDGPVYCYNSALESIVMADDHGTTWHCEYCGSAVPPHVYLCPGCQNPRSAAHMGCVADFRGIIPYAAHLFGLGKGDVVEVLYGCCSNPRVYREESCIVRLREFEIVTIAVPNIMAMYPGDMEVMECLIRARCQAEMYFDRLLKAQERD